MYLFHPSNKKFNIVKVNRFGEHFYTQNDKKSSTIKRSFYYLFHMTSEKGFTNTKYIYVIDVKRKDIYNLKKDPLKLKKKYKNPHTILSYIKKRYLGAMYKPYTYSIVCIFKDMKPIRIITRRK